MGLDPAERFGPALRLQLPLPQLDLLVPVAFRHPAVDALRVREARQKLRRTRSPVAQPTGEILPELHLVGRKSRPEIEHFPLVQMDSRKELSQLIGCEALGVPAITVHLLNPFHKLPFLRTQRPVQGGACRQIQRDGLGGSPTAEINRNNLSSVGRVVQQRQHHRHRMFAVLDDGAGAIGKPFTLFVDNLR